MQKASRGTTGSEKSNSSSGLDATPGQCDTARRSRCNVAPDEFDSTLETCFMAGYDHMPELLDDTPSRTYIREHGPDTILFAIKLGALVAEHERNIGLYAELPAEMRLEQPALILTADRAPDPEKLDILREAIPAIDEVLNEKRTTGDRSPSGYDMSTANYAVQAAWTDQEIVDLCIYRRVRHGHDPKLRLDYWQRTINKAREDRPANVSLHERQTTPPRTRAGKAKRDVADMFKSTGRMTK